MHRPPGPHGHKLHFFSVKLRCTKHWDLPANKRWLSAGARVTGTGRHDARCSIYISERFDRQKYEVVGECFQICHLRDSHIYHDFAFRQPAGLCVDSTIAITAGRRLELHRRFPHSTMRDIRCG